MHTIIALFALGLSPVRAAPIVSLAYDASDHTSSESVPLVMVLDPAALSALQTSGFSLAETLGGASADSQAARLYRSHVRYRAFADVLGRPLAHDPETDQLPSQIPADAGDIPEMVRLLRGFEDRGKRSSKDRTGGFFIRQLANNSQYPYEIEYDGDAPRHFDPRWLQSKLGRFQLIAVVNRMDRMDFNPKSCGEVRFVYRLSYRSKEGASTLPFFVNVVHEYPETGGCAEYAKRWMISPAFSKKLRRRPRRAAQQMASFLADGPLKESRFKQLEVNFQSLRFTSGYMHDLGGQAMYMQRIFRDHDGRFVPIALENTPDVLAVERSPELFDGFVAFIKKPENLKALDEGTLVIDFDDRFLARRSVSWSTLGRTRLANKPYRRLLKDRMGTLKGIDYARLKYIKSPEALIERLDNLTCQGCHQMGGTAGFHMLGVADPEYSHGFNQSQLPYSPHTFAELFRRRAYVQALADGQTPNRFRPHSSFPPGTWSSEGLPTFEELPVRSLCIKEAGHFSNPPSCRSTEERPTECRHTVTADAGLVGECTMKTAPSAAHYFAGGACFSGELQEEPEVPKDRGPIPTANFFAFQDRLKLTGSLHKNRGRGKKTERYSCASPKSGAPLGRRGRRCMEKEESFAVLDGFVPGKAAPVTFRDLKEGARPTEMCANQGGNGFDMCAARGDSGACLESRVARAMLDTCWPGAFCRDDYICQKVPEYHQISRRDYHRKKRKKRVNLSSPSKIKREVIHELHAQNVGFCVPTYFLFNMRVDGHPSPVTGRSPGVPRYDRTQPLRGYPQ